MATIGQIVQLVGSLDPNQMRTLHQFLGERMSLEGRGIPEFFGELPRDPAGVGSFGNAGQSLPGPGEDKKRNLGISLVDPKNGFRRPQCRKLKNGFQESWRWLVFLNTSFN